MATGAHRNGAFRCNNVPAGRVTRTRCLLGTRVAIPSFEQGALVNAIDLFSHSLLSICLALFVKRLRGDARGSQRDGSMPKYVSLADTAVSPSLSLVGVSVLCVAIEWPSQRNQQPQSGSQLLSGFRSALLDTSTART